MPLELHVVGTDEQLESLLRFVGALPDLSLYDKCDLLNRAEKWLRLTDPLAYPLRTPPRVIEEAVDGNEQVVVPLGGTASQSPLVALASR